MYGSAASFSLLDYTSELKIIVYLFQRMNKWLVLSITHRTASWRADDNGINLRKESWHSYPSLLAGAYGLVLTFDTVTQRNLIQQSLSRKLAHIISGSLFAACWSIFSTTTQARYFAPEVPLVNCLRLVIHGFSLVTNEGLIKSVTREGDPQ
ncbi:hypothetical protein POPTR_008G029000v4 [Populus trichocarpa]|uniref:Uncharacterized protein n=1 Tax=Populus trichocarpa TaxID=3694 RepID=A0ACC0SJF7_POPTR|nr:hypothetical protein POPTR_008G029000v4 [Populus trichocarpa]